ncbi:MAG: DNA repair protein RadC [Clostridium sp.]|nr:DNA repair protein RadC [Clostridium sp.]MCM1444479.1 DNA repair protein RadC [Candidatus Amulumruptor caecigallinarius]
MKIKDIPVSDRPIERIINYGVENVSDEELVAVLLNTGTKDLSSKALASILLSNIGGIKNLKEVTLNGLLKIKGIGLKKATTIIASIELGRRINKKIDTLYNVKATRPDIVYEYYKDRLSDKKQEYFYAVYLDNSKKVICERLLYIGTINHSLIHPREIYKEAYLCSASSIILIHNHPSGNLNPSNEDIESTIKLSEIGELFGIKIVDHIIIGQDGYFSFVENGII